MTTQRHYSPIDRLLLQADAAMRTLLPFSGQPYRPSPAILQPDTQMSDEDTRHVAGLMRINHTGEVCAQALYQGQALTAKLPQVRAAMEHAAEEEIDHLVWCEQRIHQQSTVATIGTDSGTGRSLNHTTGSSMATTSSCAIRIWRASRMLA